MQFGYEIYVHVTLYEKILRVLQRMEHRESGKLCNERDAKSTSPLHRICNTLFIR